MFPRVGFDTCCPFNLCYDTLTNKPNSVSDELESSGWIELACCHFKTLVACFDKLFQRKTFIKVLFCNTHYKAQIAIVQYLNSSLIAILYAVGKLNFLLYS